MVQDEIVDRHVSTMIWNEMERLSSLCSLFASVTMVGILMVEW